MSLASTTAGGLPGTIDRENRVGKERSVQNKDHKSVDGQSRNAESRGRSLILYCFFF